MQPKTTPKKRIRKTTTQKLDRDFLQAIPFGGNINQIAKAINTDIASSRPLDAARLLHLLIGIDQTLKELKK